ncbi:MAG: HD-GYP domain-containing protein [FCB group bacterium]|jgi:HD-GYP domain-containing protein (c-di-GMP phosphodiesterase class II)|nr:HD-GYP domain-containing protein [FCB group bacterium]
MEVKEGESGTDRFIPIRLTSLRVDSITDFDIFIGVGTGLNPVLYRERNLSFTEEARERLLTNGIENLLIDKSQEREYRRYIEDNLSSLLADPAVEPGAKSEMLYYSARGLMEDVMADPRSGEVIPRSRAFVDNTCDFLVNERRAFHHLLRVTSYDYYTYTHSVNVFVFSVSLAQRAGFTDPKILKEFGEGALLHDIGKSMIDSSIVNCRGRLDRDQWEEMKKHPGYGYDILVEQGVTSPMVLSVVRHHHEKIRGGGYPDGLSGDEIPPLTRISTIADIFDALTTKRSYKVALSSFPALEMMMKEMSADLDPDFFRTFVGMMGNSGA